MSQYQTPPTPTYDDSDQSAPTITIVALVSGILGMCVFPFALVALICGIIGLSKTGTPGKEKGRGFALAGTILGGIAIVVAPLLIAILLPALGAARRTARRMQNSTQLRGMHQGLMTYANSNKNNFAGLDSTGQIVVDGAQTGNSGAGNTPQARMWILLDGNFFTPDYAISPSEIDPSITPYAGTVPVTADDYSYAMLQIDATSNAAGRLSEWKQTLNSQAIVLSDRNTGSNTSTSIQSIHAGDPGDWRGSVLWNDNHVGFENTPVFQTLYANGNMNQQDHLFEEDQPAGYNALMEHK